MKSLNFWRSLFFSALAVAAFGACSDDDEKGDFDAVIKVDDKKETTVGIAAAGGETPAVTVTSAGPWTLAFEADQEWCFPNVTSGKGGSTELVFSVDPMPAGVEERSATAVLSAPGRIFEVEYIIQVRVTVRQSESGSTIPATNVAKVRELLVAMNPTDTKTAVTEELAAMTITGVVVSEASGVNWGNAYNIAVQDDGEAKNSGLTLNATKFANLALSAGQVVAIPLTGATVSTYLGALQLNIANDTEISVVGTTPDAPAPIVITPDALPDYESMLVQIDNCYATAGIGAAWNGNTVFTTTSGETFTVRVGNSATFKSDLIPNKSGSMIGLAGINKTASSTVYQVSPRTTADIRLTEEMPAPEYKTVKIDQITAAGNYKVENATVVATYKAGFVMQDDDATGVMLVFLNAVPDVTVGKVVTVEGAVSAYGGVLQFGEGTTVTETASGSAPTPPQPVEITADNIAGYMTAPKVTYVKATGILAISGNYNNFNFTFESEYTGSVSSPNDDLGFPALNGKLIDIEGWFVNNGNASGTGKYFTVVATGVSENTTVPALSFTTTPKAFAGSSPAAQTISFTTQNIEPVSADMFSFEGTDADKFQIVSWDATSVTINAVGDAPDGPYTAKLVAKLGDVVLDEVVLTQEKAQSATDKVITVTFDSAESFTNVGIGTKSSDGFNGEKQITVDGYTYTLNATTNSYGISSTTSGVTSWALFIGQKDSYIEFPAIEGAKLVSVEIFCGASMANSNILNIADASGTKYSTDFTTGTADKGTTHKFDCTGTAVNTSYRMVMYAAKNLQITGWRLTYSE